MCIAKANSWHQSPPSAGGAVPPPPALRLVNGDTDSMFVHVLPRQQQQQQQQHLLLIDAFDRMREFARVCNAMLPNPMELELEKIFFPCILATKKRYVGMAFESSKQVDGAFDAKGIESVRRDTCPLVQVPTTEPQTSIDFTLGSLGAHSLPLQTVMEAALRLLFATRDLSAVRRQVEQTFVRLLRGEVPLQELAFAKEVRLGTYRAPPPAAQLAAQRLTSDAAAITLYGERVAFVVVYGPPGARLCDCVMPPLEVKARAIPTDIQFNICSGYCQGRQRASQRSVLHHQVHPAFAAAVARPGWRRCGAVVERGCARHAAERRGQWCGSERGGGGERADQGMGPGRQGGRAAAAASAAAEDRQLHAV